MFTNWLYGGHLRKLRMEKLYFLDLKYCFLLILVIVSFLIFVVGY